MWKTLRGSPLDPTVTNCPSEESVRFVSSAPIPGAQWYQKPEGKEGIIEEGCPGRAAPGRSSIVVKGV
jgi:hypothetical protein